MESNYKTGIERFYDRYPDYQTLGMDIEYLGVGAMTEPPERVNYENSNLCKNLNKQR